MTTFDCDEFRDTAPDLALGLLTGDERGAAISHVVTCASCRRHLDGLVQVADDLLLLAPSVEPEIGFESRVMARLAARGAFSPEPAPGPGGTTASSLPAPSSQRPASQRPASQRPGRATGPRSGRRISAGHHPGPSHPSPPSRSRVVRRRAAVVVAALALAVVTGVTGLTAGTARGRNAGRAAALANQATAANQLAARTAVVWADKGQSWCQLVAFPSHGSLPAQLVIRLEEPGEPPGSYQVLAEPTNGQPAVLVGTIVVTNGRGTLTAAVPAGTGPVDAIRVIDADRALKYRATFASV
jgi:type II secretory pathway pseudopilin PulG